MRNNNFFSKLKDYNHILDELLEKKSFSEDTKNLLLSMSYKIESSYKDYSIAKKIDRTKIDFINDIIDTIREYCNSIKLLKPGTKESKVLKEKNVVAITDEKEKSILAYPTEQSLLFAISDIKPKFFYIGKKYYYIKEEWQKILSEGTNLNNTEVIRNFNGWSWNLEGDKNINKISNLIYQILLILLGYDFLEKWQNDFSGKKDYILEIKKRLENETSKLLMDNFYLSLCHLIIANNSDKSKYKNDLERYKSKYDEMENKPKYILKVSREKKKISSQIKDIDKIINNRNLLLEEYNSRNAKLEEEKKIFNISTLVDILQNDREILVKKLKELSDIEKPSNFVKIKNDIEEKINILNVIEDDNIEIKKYNLEFQKSFLKIINKRIDLADSKEKIINIIYYIRYYKSLYFDNENKVYEVPELKNIIDRVLKKAITKACNNSVFNIFCKDIDMNYKIISLAIGSSIINLEDIDLNLVIDGEELKVNIFDNEVFDRTEKIKFSLNKKDLNVKLKKNIPLYNF